MADYFDEMRFDRTQDHASQFNNYMERLMTDYNMFDELGETQRTPPPASKDEVEKLPEETVTQKGGQCLVCLKEFDVDDVTKLMPCKHKFHSACLLEWLQKTNSCPLCRFELPTDSPTYEAYRKEKIRARERVNDIDNLHNSMFT